MYTVRCDNALLLNNLLDEYKLGKTTLNMKSNQAGSLSFIIHDVHPNYNVINLLSSRVKVYKDGTLKWIGRPKMASDEGKRAKKYYCEGCLSYLKDSYIPPYKFNGSPAAFFSYIIGLHNSVAGENQQFVVGECTVTDPNDYIVRSSINFQNAYDVIMEKLVAHFGGYLYITFDQNENPVISYYADVPNTTTQLIEFGENLVNYEEEILYDEMYTACVPLGVKLANGEERLTIESVNDGVPHLVNQTLAAQYGIRYAPTKLTTWEDVTVPANLKTKGQDWLDNVGVKYKNTISLNAIDISTIKQGIGSFEFLWKVGFKPRHGATVYYVISELEIDLNMSANQYINLGDTKELYTGLIGNAVSNVTSRVDVIEADYTTKQQSKVVAETVIETTTEIQTQAAAIIASVLESYYTKGEVDEALVNQALSLRSQIQQLSDSVTTSFEYYESVSDEMNSTITDIRSWVKIIAETPTSSGGIIIGNSRSAIKLKLENDILYFYRGEDSSPVYLMWLDSETLHINKVEIQELSIGYTGRMLSFKIVGTGANTSAAFIGRYTA